MTKRIIESLLVLLLPLLLASCGGGSSGTLVFIGLWNGTLTITTTSEDEFCQLFVGDVEFLHQINQSGTNVVIEDLDSPEDPPWNGTVSADGRSFTADSTYPRSWETEAGRVDCQATETLTYSNLRFNSANVSSFTDFVCTITEGENSETVSCPLASEGSGTRQSIA